MSNPSSTTPSGFYPPFNRVPHQEGLFSNYDVKVPIPWDSLQSNAQAPLSTASNAQVLSQATSKQSNAEAPLLATSKDPRTNQIKGKLRAKNFEVLIKTAIEDAIKQFTLNDIIPELIAWMQEEEEEEEPLFWVRLLDPLKY